MFFGTPCRFIHMLAWIELEGGEGWGERGLPATPAKKTDSTYAREKLNLTSHDCDIGDFKYIAFY